MEVHIQDGRRLIAKNSAFNLLGFILPSLVGVVTIPYIIRGLGANGYGILSIAWMVLGYFSVFDLGLGRATTKFVAEHLAPDKVHRVPEIVWTSLTLLLASATIGAMIMAAFVPLAVTHFFKMPANYVGEARTALFILCASLPILLANDALRGVLEAAQRFDLVNYVKVPSSILFYLSAALVIPFGVKVSGIVFILVLIRLTSTFAYLSMCFRVFPGLRAGFTVSKSAIRPLASFGGWIMVTNVTGPIFGNVERFLIASVISVGMLTYYSAPYDLVSKILILPSSIVPSLFPYFSYHGSENSREVSEVTARTAKYLLVVLTPVTAVFVFFARQILQLWLGTQFANQSTMVLQIVAILCFVNAFAMIPYTSVQALGRPNLKAIEDLISLPVYAVVGYLLMKRMGINGAALAKLLITIADCTFLYIFAWRMKAFSFRDCISGPLFRAMLASAGLSFVVFLISSMHAKLIVSLILLVPCFAAYVATFWLVAVDAEDRITIKSLLDRALSVLVRREVSTAV